MSSTDSSSRLSWREYTGYALGDTASNLFFQTFTIFLTYYYVDVWGIGAGALITMMGIVRLIDAFNDPLMGLIADRTQTRWGKFRPYLLWMAVPYGVCGYLLFANPDLQGDSKLVYAYVTYTMMLIAYTAINVPYSSLLGVISHSSGVRTQASSFRFVGAFGGGLMVSLLVRPLVAKLGGGDEVSGFQQTMAIFGVVSVILFWITFATVKERVKPPVNQKTNAIEELGELLKNKPWIILLFAAIASQAFQAMRSGSTLFYFKYVVKASDEPILFGVFDEVTVFLSASMLCQMLGALAFSAVARKVDKRRWSVGLCVATAVFLSASYFLPPDNFGLLLVVNMLATLCMGPTSALVWAMYADVADYGEWKFGRRSTGLVYSASLFALKTGSMVAGMLLPWFLLKYDFVPNVDQTPDAILGITLAFSIVPGVFVGGKALALWLFPLRGSDVKKIEKELASRRQESANDAAGSAEAQPA